MTGPVRLGVHPTGVEVHIMGERLSANSARFEEALAVARQYDAHIWTIVVAHHISHDLAVRLVRQPGEEPHLDAESIVTVGIGCFRCEQELSGPVLASACPGDAEGP